MAARPTQAAIFEHARPGVSANLAEEGIVVVVKSPDGAGASSVVAPNDALRLARWLERASLSETKKAERARGK